MNGQSYKMYNITSNFFFVGLAAQWCSVLKLLGCTVIYSPPIQIVTGVRRTDVQHKLQYHKHIHWFQYTAIKGFQFNWTPLSQSTIWVLSLLLCTKQICQEEGNNNNVKKVKVLVMGKSQKDLVSRISGYLLRVLLFKGTTR